MQVLVCRDTPFDETTFVLAQDTSYTRLRVIKDASDLVQESGTRKRARLASATSDWRVDVTHSARGLMRDGVVLLIVCDDSDAVTVTRDHVIGRYDASIWRDYEALSSAAAHLHAHGDAATTTTTTTDGSSLPPSTSYRRRSSDLFTPLIVAYEEDGTIYRVCDEWWLQKFGASCSSSADASFSDDDDEANDPDEAEFWHSLVQQDSEVQVEDLNLPLGYIIQSGINEMGWDRVTEHIYEPGSETHFVRYSRVTESSTSHTGECFFCGTQKPLQLRISELAVSNKDALPEFIGRTCLRQYTFLLRYLDFCSQYTNACQRVTPQTHASLCRDLARRHSLLCAEAHLVFSVDA